MKLTAWLVTSLGVFANPAYTSQSVDNYQQQIEQAIVAFENTPIDKWAFQLTRYENEEGEVTQSVEAYMPIAGKESHWTLLSQNKQQPSAKQQQKFRQQKAKKDQVDNGLAIKLRELINQDALSLVSTTPTHLTLAYPLKIEKLGDDALGKLSATLRYNQQQQFIEQITIVNQAAFSPMFSAEITDFRLTFSFIKIADAILPKQQWLNMQGTFAYFTKIDEYSSDSYDNYQFVGTP